MAMIKSNCTVIIQRALILAISLTNPTIGHAENHPAVDAGQFDIAGIKLGMSTGEAIDAVCAKLHIGRNSVKFGLREPLPVSKRIEPKFFSLGTDKFSITVHLEQKIPFDARNPMVVCDIVYEQPWTRENASAMETMAFEKYGPPSNGAGGLGYVWCLQPHRYNGGGCDNNFNGPVLEIAGTTLILRDPRYFRAVIDLINKKNSSRPEF
jgi:hypothetical protein